MEEPIESEYFNWLCAKVVAPTRHKMYCDLLKLLHETEFAWTILGDRNRMEDGLELRIHFLRQSRWNMDRGWYSQPCSVLELLIAFADRACFQTDIPLETWFWEFMSNLELGEFRQVQPSDVDGIKDILHTFVWRTYDPSGYGGIFPMRWPKRDQRKVEIWYQFCDYLDDRGMI